MNLFAFNVLLAIGFMIVLDSFTLQSLLAGFILGFAALWLTHSHASQTSYFGRTFKVLKLIVFFAKELLISNLRVVWDVITPAHISRPGIVRVPLDAKTDFEIMMVANLISLTPGTLSIDLSEDRRYLYVHVMFMQDVAEIRREFKQGLEKRVLEVLR